jgi:hypothetical protein
LNYLLLAKLSVLCSLEIVLTFRHSQAKQQAHEQEMRNLALKAKEEASQAAKDLEKVK